jgi:hypothetical protein
MTPFTSFAEGLSPLTADDISSISGDRSWAIASEADIYRDAFGFTAVHGKQKHGAIEQEPRAESSAVPAHNARNGRESRVSAKSAAAAVFNEMRGKRSRNITSKGMGTQGLQTNKRQRLPLAAKVNAVVQPVKRGRGRPKGKPGRPRGRPKAPPKKVDVLPESIPLAPKRKRGRPRKHPLPVA